ncbi:MAG: hypothetical protein WCO19_04180 [Candidatus Saccharibacteria bacterium]
MPPITPQQPQKPGQPVPPTNNQPAGMQPGFGAGIGALQAQQAQNTQKTTAQKQKVLQIVLGVLVFFLLVAVGFAIFLGSQLATAKRVNSVQYDSGYSSGSTEQQKKDADQATKDSLSDSKTYTAPKELGEFSFSVPKNFSVQYTYATSKDRLIVLANPDVIDTKASYLGLRAFYKNDLYTNVKTEYDKNVKDKKNNFKASEEIVVDGRKATRYVGQLEKRDKPGTIVLIEVRDSTIILQTDNNENTTLLQAFNTAVQSLKIP